MINGKHHKELILDLLSDGKPHFSAEFRDKLKMLEYRRRLTELRRDGYEIVSMNIHDGLFGKSRPGYRMIGRHDTHEAQV